MLPVQCKMARAALDLGVKNLAQQAGVSSDTVTRFERGLPVRERTVADIRNALEQAGIVFIPENGGGAGVRLKFTRRDVKAIDTLENEGGIVADDDS